MALRLKQYTIAALLVLSSFPACPTDTTTPQQKIIRLILLLMTGEKQTDSM